MNYELYHHGIIGQKWGKRNGPPYPLNDKTVRELKTTANESANITKNINNARKSIRSSRIADTDLSSLTDKELKDIVNRMNMEQQYHELSNKQMAQGKDTVTTTLEVAGSALSAVGSALSIALAIKALKGASSKAE